MKKPVKMALIALAAVVVIGFVVNGFVSSVLSAAMSGILRTSVSIGSASLNPFTSTIDLRGIRVKNPKGFKDKLMLDAPQVACNLDLPSVFSDPIHFQAIILNVKEIVVVKNKEGVLNVNAIKPQAGESKKPAKQGSQKKLKIDRLVLTIGRVTYKDYTLGPEPIVQTFDINIQNREYHNIENPAGIGSLIMFEALKNTTLSRIANLDLGDFQADAQGLLKQGLGALDDSAGSLGSKAKEILNIFK